MSDLTREKFTSREVIAISKGLHLDFDDENRRDWHRRKIIPGEPVGRGCDRYYSFEELVHIEALAFVAPHMRYGGLSEAGALAQALGDAIAHAITTKAAGDVGPVYVLVCRAGGAIFEPVSDKQLFSTTATIYGFRGAVAVHPAFMAAELVARIEDVLAQREGFADAWERDKQEREGK